MYNAFGIEAHTFTPTVF